MNTPTATMPTCARVGPGRAPLAWRVRAASAADLKAINRIVRRAVQTWSVAPRVQRLALPTLEYRVHDLAAVECLVAEVVCGVALGVAAWEHDVRPAARERGPAMLHGLYVDPSAAGRRIGTTLPRAVVEAARSRDLAGVRERAWRDAEGFFLRNGVAHARSAPELSPPRNMWRSVR